MNTFLPYADFDRSVQCLDRQRLGKQRVEVLQLVKAILGETSGWRTHPCTVMWQNHIDALIQYGLCACEEWTSRGYSDSVRKQLAVRQTRPFKLPLWLGSRRLHASHRGNLRRKDPNFYTWTDPMRDGYFWPSPSYNWREVTTDGVDPYFAETDNGLYLSF